MSAYSEALADPSHVELEPGVIMRPFHQPTWQGQEFHLYCEQHPDFGFCGFEVAVREEALQHVHYEHERGSSDRA